MPEGPEVRRAADRIERAIGGKPLQNVRLETPKLDIPSSVLKGNILRRVQTYSKAFVLEFDQDISIYVHLQLYGVWKTGRIHSPPKTRRSLRIWLETDTHYAALYSATEIEARNPQTIVEHPYIKKLGPDLLNRSTYGVGHVSRRLGQKKFARRRLGHLLLDQSFFAGVGNYLRSEILFDAGLHPNQTLGKMNANQKTALARSIHTMLHRAYKTGGVTLDPQRVAKAKSKGVTRRNYRHFTFARASKSCYQCGSKIEKHFFAGRRLYLCPVCQPEATVDTLSIR
ncbi:MAG: endonuclease VIII [Myxococcota bacterium]|nr:endonuclease VIII [Myxococcota bacterium]